MCGYWEDFRDPNSRLARIIHHASITHPAGSLIRFRIWETATIAVFLEPALPPVGSGFALALRVPT
jgi:hypothetical protein